MSLASNINNEFFSNFVLQEEEQVVVLNLNGVNKLAKLCYLSSLVKIGSIVRTTVKKVKAETIVYKNSFKNSCMMTEENTLPKNQIM